MQTSITGNLMVVQCSEGCPVANAILAGVVSEALNHESIENVYGCLKGLHGLLHEEIIDLAEESQQTIRALQYTPGAALGTSALKLKRPQDIERALQVLKAQEVHSLILIGDSETQESALKIAQTAEENGYELRVIGIPASIENNLPVTDHCLGFGSAAKALALTVRELSCELASSITTGPRVHILEVPGTQSGWVAASATLAKRRNEPEDAPHIVCLPETHFQSQSFLSAVQKALVKHGYAMVVAAEGITDADGNFIAQPADLADTSSRPSVAELLANLVRTQLSVRAEWSRLGTLACASAHCLSLSDVQEAQLAGQAAVIATIQGKTARMVTLTRAESDTYKVETSLVPLSEVCGGIKAFPATWISEGGHGVSFQFSKYALPFIQGEVALAFDNGLPKFARLNCNKVTRTQGAHSMA